MSPDFQTGANMPKETLLENQYRLRIQNCIWTILDVYDSVCDEEEPWESFSMFEKLEQDIEDMDMDHISEADVRMVEQATNELLIEFRPFFEYDSPNQAFVMGNN